MRKTLFTALAPAVMAALALTADPGAKLVSHVLDRIHESEPTRAERRLDAIGWAPDIRAAQRLAREHHRPVFLFTHDGNIATGRC